MTREEFWEIAWAMHAAYGWGSLSSADPDWGQTLHCGEHVLSFLGPRPGVAEKIHLGGGRSATVASVVFKDGWRVTIRVRS